MSSTAHHSTGVAETLREMAPALTGNPVAVWHAARTGTEGLSAALPNTMGLDHVKDFVRRHPVVATCVALAVGYYFVGGSLFGRNRRR